ncbi:hypothetical protein RTBOTA2_004252 [Rhodotorula toruloides]|nr:hypothetical protein RTBOTA2_004252 [Rhodotorula toruloides]
MRIGRIL